MKFKIRHRKAARVGIFFLSRRYLFFYLFRGGKRSLLQLGFLRCFYKRQTAPRNTVQSFWLLLLSAVNATICRTRNALLYEPTKKTKKTRKRRKETKREEKEGEMDPRYLRQLHEYPRRVLLCSTSLTPLTD